MDTKETSSGVQKLIDKLRNQGVNEGHRQAEKIIEEAHSKAAHLLSEAQREADKLLAETRHKLEVERKSSHEAIKIAFRDSEIALRTHLREAFAAHLKKLVSLEVRDKEFIKELVLTIAGKKAAEIATAPRVEILLPAALVEGDGENSYLNSEGKRRLRHLVLGITDEMLREGVELTPSSDIKGGIRVQLVGKDIEIDLTNDALSKLIFNYLLPRYRDIVSGQV